VECYFRAEEISFEGASTERPLKTLILYVELIPSSWAINHTELCFGEDLTSALESP
jgi:hypothetical protein